MKYRSIVCVIVIFAFAHTSANKAKVYRNTKTFSNFDSLSESLKYETWEQEEVTCLRGVEAILNGVRNNTLWASWVWNSMQLPVGTFYGSQYHFGNFDQCLNVPWTSEPGLQTQYCLVDVKITNLTKYDGENVNPYDDAAKFIGAEFKNGRRLNYLHLGVCLPNSCKPDSIAKISSHIFKLSHLPFEEVTVDPKDCQVAGMTTRKPMGYYIFWFIIISLPSISIFVYIFGNILETENSTVSKILRCFCLTRNFESLTTIRRDEVMMLHGMRALTSGYVIAIHLFFMTQFVAVFNRLDAEKEHTDSYIKLLRHTDLTIDTFFVMSGLLQTKRLMSSQSITPLKTVLQRYIRFLLPLYALSLMNMTYVFPFIGSGPAWPRLSRMFSEPCIKSWWRNILMITNRVDENGHCLDISWYSHTDFQLTVLVTALFMVYRRSKKTAVVLCALTYIVSVVVPAVWTYVEELPGLLLYDFGESNDFSRNRVYLTVYQPVYTRASAYLIGVVMGYITTFYKPQHYRRRISKNNSIFTFILGISLMILCLYCGAKSFRKEYSVMVTAILAATDRSIWSLGICFVIISCEYGTLPIINDFLSSKVFVPLSKLSYCNYLLHTIFIHRNICSLRTPATYDTFGLITNGLGYVVMSCSVSYLIWLFIEAPATNFINLLFDFKGTSKIQNTNGVVPKSEKHFK